MAGLDGVEVAVAFAAQEGHAVALCRRAAALEVGGGVAGGKPNLGRRVGRDVHTERKLPVPMVPADTNRAANLVVRGLGPSEIAHGLRVDEDALEPRR